MKSCRWATKLAGHNWRSRGQWSRRVAVLTGFILLPGLLAPVAFAGPLGKPDPLGVAKLSAPRSAEVSAFTAKENKAAAAARKKAEQADRSAITRAKNEQSKSVTWPAGGTAVLTLPKGETRPAAADPGSLPLTLAAPSAAKGTAQRTGTAGTVKAEVLDQEAAHRLGVKGVVLKVTGPKGGGRARLGVDYSAFASAYGGDWAGRLRMVRLPDCALKDPAKAACRTRTTLVSDNDRPGQTLGTQLTFPPAPAGSEPATMMLALAAGTESGAGDFKATPLSSSSTWEAGGSSGTFTWSYPLRTPPAAAGPSPDLAISYDSGSVDGRTASTNNQGTAVGEGFDLTSSYVERKYGTCDDDGQTDKFDLCWKYDNASLVLNGKASELVKDDTTGVWRLKNDDASTVTHSTGADNGDDNGEYWTVTTGEGTKYVFGLNKLAGAPADERTQSVWTVPVFGDDSGEPGYSDGTSLSGRDKTQAWRWNLDYVEDLHENAMSYWYAAETNNYDTLGDDSTGTAYTRGGYLKEIRYGQRAGALFSGSPAASDKVTFNYTERCTASGTGCDALTEDTRDNWPDVPFDTVCKTGDKCTGNVGPAFFTRKRMTAITTYAWDAAAATPAFTPVDTWSLKQQYLDPGDTGDSTDQSLWLDEIRHTGKRGADLSLPPVRFDHEMRANRVDSGSDDILPLNKPRLKQIISETGAQSIVTYADEDCVAGQTKPKVDENTRHCYPVYWSPNGAKDPQLDWFQKYPVTSVSTTDPLGGSEALVHTYQYAGGGAWHYNDDPLTKEKERTWSIWRGFAKVTHLTGRSDRTQSKTVTVYLRGMDGDRLLGPDGKTPDPDKRRTAKVTGIKAGEITDADPYAGFTRETVTYNEAQEVGGQINDPWSKKTATQHKSYADTEAYFVRTAATHARTNITTSGTAKDRIRTTATTFDGYGMPATVEDRGDDAVTGDETCTRNTYARNDALGINSLVSRSRVVAKLCSVLNADLDLPTDSTRPGDVVSDTATAYDATAYTTTQTPTKGEARWTGRAKSYAADGTPSWQRIAVTSYDTLGRPLTVKDVNDTTVTTTAYVPAAAGPLTKTTVANAKAQTTTSLLDPATGAATRVTDPNNKVTDNEYDSLGRIIKVWPPTASKALGNPPTYVYGYSVTATALPWTSTGVIRGDGSGDYNTTYEIFDSLLRPRQVQLPSPVGGRTIAQTLYDERGLAVSAQADIWDEKAPPSGAVVETDSGQAPTQTDTTYDGAGRPVQAVTKNFNVTRWTTDTAYTGDTVTTTAPKGGQATAVVTDALGRTTENRQYAGTQPTGSSFTATRYTYTPAGQQKTVTGPDNAAWSYGYDLFGRQTSNSDPDKGKSTTAYDSLDQVISTTDVGRNKTLISEYDALGRKTGLWDGSKTDANRLAAWTFDTLAKGKPDTSVRYENGVGTPTSKAYTQKVTKYDAAYRAQQNELTLPASDPLVAAGVPQTLKSSSYYNTIDGTLTGEDYPAVAGLPSESTTNTYNGYRQQLTADGRDSYLLDATYAPVGDLRQLVLGTNGTAPKASLNYDYEPGTRRLTRSYVTDDVHGYMPQELKFTQDDAGNVTSIFDATTQGGTAKADYQCFTYDGHRRLTDAWTPKTADCATTRRTTANIDGAAPYWTSYTYNTAGQRKTETQHATAGDSTTNYTYGTPAPASQPHALTSTTGVKAGAYEYDAAGNTTSRPGAQAKQTLTWNSEGDLVSATEPAAGTKPATGTSYLYDAGGELLISRNTTGDGDTVLYLGNTEVRLTTKGTSKTLTGTRYYEAAGQTTAIRAGTAGVTTTKLSFLAADHHGTSSLVLEAGTYAITKRHTTPFGAPRGTTPTTWPDDKGFLGKPADTTTGLTHIGAREYDPGIGQFISVDPVLALDQHQSMNGYAYANQNPVTHSDPTGMWIDDGTGHSEPIDDGHGDHNLGPDGKDKWPVPGGSGGGGGTASAPSSGGGKGGGSSGGGSNCGLWSKCGLANLIDDGGAWFDRNKGMIASVATEVVVGGACFGAAAGAGLATGGVGFGAAAGCGAVAGAAGSAVGNAFEENADHSASGQLAAQAEGALWGAAGAGALYGVGKVVKFLAKCHSFLPGTGVLLADGTRKSIEDVDVGDTVVTTDTKTGKTVKKKVVSTITTEDDKDFTKITISVGDGHSSIVATDTHPFWVPELKKWVKAGDLNPGQWLRTSAGTHVQITEVTHYTKHQRTHDLTIQDIHAYYVLAGATPVLVHNCDPVKNFGVPNTPGVYTIHLNSGEKYVGMSTANIQDRVAASIKPGHAVTTAGYSCADICNVSWIPLPAGVKSVTARRVEQSVMEGLKSRGVSLVNRRDPEFDVSGLGDKLNWR
ncbi:RHS repeat-associated core domain-containing protein [Streptomyces niveus]|uniref:RHS repeat-associated core domain-containing protein n=1 Tax=Streptomyces niveus TaxID=193462 RepID=UPI003412FD8F